MKSERWLVTGASGQLGGHVVSLLASAADRVEILALARASSLVPGGVPVARVDLADFEALRRQVREFHPTNVAHIGAMTAVGDCYRDQPTATRVNTNATRVLAEAAAECNARVVFTSTDMVFAGDDAPYRETDEPNPPSFYGVTKLAAERAIAEFDRTLTVRIPLLYGAPVTDRQNTFTQQIAALRSCEPLKLFTDEYRTPIWVADAADALIALCRSDLTGVIHVSGPERLSRYEMVRRFAELLEIADPQFVPVSRLSIDSAEPRPEDLSLDGTVFTKQFPDLAPGPIRPAAFGQPSA